MIISFIYKVIEENESPKKVWDLDQFVMPSTERALDADIYVRELRDNDRF